MDGQPSLYVNKEVDPGLIATLTQDVIPWLEANVAKTPEPERRLAKDARAHWFTMVFDREGYSPELFEKMRKKRIAILTYHKFPREDWRREEFQLHSVELAGGETVTIQLAERGSQLSNKLWLREIRKLTDSGHQTSILTTNFQAPMTTLAVSLFARWSQENFFRYMREHYGLDHLIEYGTEPICLKLDRRRLQFSHGRRNAFQGARRAVAHRRLAVGLAAFALVGYFACGAGVAIFFFGETRKRPARIALCKVFVNAFPTNSSGAWSKPPCRTPFWNRFKRLPS